MDPSPLPRHDVGRPRRRLRRRRERIARRGAEWSVLHLVLGGDGRGHPGLGGRYVPQPRLDHPRPGGRDPKREAVRQPPEHRHHAPPPAHDRLHVRRRLDRRLLPPRGVLGADGGPVPRPGRRLPGRRHDLHARSVLGDAGPSDAGLLPGQHAVRERHRRSQQRRGPALHRRAEPEQPAAPRRDRVRRGLLGARGRRGPVGVADAFASRPAAAAPEPRTSRSIAPCRTGAKARPWRAATS
jgi:hypothetical protein